LQAALASVQLVLPGEPVSGRAELSGHGRSLQTGGFVQRLLAGEPASGQLS